MPKGPRRKGAEKIAADMAKFDAQEKRHVEALAKVRLDREDYIAAVKAEMDALSKALTE